jgi:hypothetical protein
VSESRRGIARLDAADVLTLLSEPMRSANEAGHNDHADPLLSFSDEVVGDDLAQLDRPGALTCITEQRYAVKVAARIVPEAVADPLKTGAVKGRRPAPAKGVIVTPANLECDAKAASLADTAVSELHRRRHAQSCESARAATAAPLITRGSQKVSTKAPSGCSAL